jgi:hypothetical protein
MTASCTRSRSTASTPASFSMCACSPNALLTLRATHRLASDPTARYMRAYTVSEEISHHAQR